MRNYSPEEKLQLVKLVLEEHRSINSISQEANIAYTTLKGWIRNYQSIGTEAFYKKGWTKRSSEEKKAAVADYLSGIGSIHDVCKKYKISDTHTLRQWIALYNGHKELKASGNALEIDVNEICSASPFSGAITEEEIYPTLPDGLNGALDSSRIKTYLKYSLYPLMHLFGKNSMPDVNNLLTSFYQLDDEAGKRL